MRKAVYTVLINGYDTLKNFRATEGWDYICFTDDKSLKAHPWETRHVKLSDNPVKQQRDIKIRPHHYLPEYDMTVYIDASHSLTQDLNKFISTFYKGGMLVAKHNARTCVYQEAKQVLRLGKAKKEDVDRQMNAYYKERFRTGTLYETGFMVRDKSVTALMEHWASQVQEYTHRDQLSLPYSVKKTGIVPHTLPSRVVRSQFVISKHLNLSNPRIWYLTPYSTDGNIGKEYNEQIALLPDQDWICIRDGDTCFTTPDSLWGKQIADIVKRNSDYALIGCMTNRLASNHQIYGGKFCDNPDWNEHKRRGRELFDTRYDEVTHIRQGIAGMFMLFPKKTWQRVRFKETAPYRTFDSDFSSRVMRMGKIGLAEGLYLFHDYRFGKPNPKQYVKHLK